MTVRNIAHKTRRRPVVGVSTYLESAQWGVWSRPAALLPMAYVDAVSAAGGIAVLLPPAGSGAEEAVEALDALVLAGGPDIDPAVYGAERHPETIGSQPERDTWELALLGAALEHGVPVLGVCRGMQLMNVACGGDLVQHLPDHGASAQHRPAPGSYGQHSVRLSGSGGRLAGLGPDLVVASYHHQAINRVGAGVRPIGWADDGVVEAVELSGAPFAVGVQWHPEEHEGPGGPGVFTALVQAAAA
jgi:gamma-glutamyl-gamma-aminobutyrate hydrolase PuuD